MKTQFEFILMLGKCLKEKDKLNFSVWGHDKTVKQFLEHHVDVITDSEWFENLVEEKIETSQNLSPAVRKIIAENKIDVKKIKGSG